VPILATRAGDWVIVIITAAAAAIPQADADERPGLLAHLPQGRKENRHEKRDDAEDDQQLDQGQSARPPVRVCTPPTWRTKSFLMLHRRHFGSRISTLHISSSYDTDGGAARQPKKASGRRNSTGAAPQRDGPS
jgi:hypothetical protein